MNQWYNGWIEGLPVSIFVSDDWQMDYLLDEDTPYPENVVQACEAIRASRMRSLSGVEKTLRENGWSNS